MLLLIEVEIDFWLEKVLEVVVVVVRFRVKLQEVPAMDVLRNDLDERLFVQVDRNLIAALCIRAGDGGGKRIWEGKVVCVTRLGTTGVYRIRVYRYLGTGRTQRGTRFRSRERGWTRGSCLSFFQQFEVAA